MKFKRHVELAKGRLDITPLIDVIFLLLIFFMLTSTFVLQPVIRVKLPKAITSEVLRERNLIIEVTAEGKIYFSNEIISLPKLEEKLKTIAGESKSLLIKADEKASLGQVVEVWDLCRDAGISQVSIATKH
ncbi:MAG: biopolymer transporter ExbD [Candidatus Omnitrophota bacterium]|nr:biopolymer transporter ExbD [Candidatus Omnitrophota bacterium]